MAYLDEFGHIGPYIAPDHPRFKDHPIFGYAGFVIPARNVRALGGFFENLKAQLLAAEIEALGVHSRRWEKKGASLLTTRNHEKYGSEIRPALRRISRRLTALGGRSFFYGQEKPRGSAKETGESSSERNLHMFRQAILRISRYADRCQQDVLIFTDAVDSGPRLEAVAASASFIYAAHDPALRRVSEIPMQLESHLYATTQLADWTCALLGRSSHALTVPNSEFAWAPAVFGASLGGNVVHGSRIRLLSGADLSLPALRGRPPASRSVPRVRVRGQRPVQPAAPGSLGAQFPELKAFRDGLS